jgi:hypothetical protein
MVGGGGSRELDMLKNKKLEVTVMRMNDDSAIAMAEAIKLDLGKKYNLLPQIYSGQFILINKKTSSKQREEFLLVVTKSTLENAQIVAEKLRTKVDSIFFEVVGKKTISLGVAQYHADIEQTIKAADTALYKAKKAGRNRVEVVKNSNSTYSNFPN